MPKIEQIYNLRFTSDWADVWLGWDQRWTNSKCLYLSCCNVCFIHVACVDNVDIGQLIKSNRQQFPLHTHCIQKCVEACICICMLRKLAVDAKAISVQFDYNFYFDHSTFVHQIPRVHTFPKTTKMEFFFTKAEIRYAFNFGMLWCWYINLKINNQQVVFLLFMNLSQTFNFLYCYYY